MTVTIKAGAHTRKNTLISAALDGVLLRDISADQPVGVRYPGGKTLPAQLNMHADGSAVLMFVLDYLARGESASLTLVNTADHAPVFCAEHTASEGKVSLCIGGAEYTAYR